MVPLRVTGWAAGVGWATGPTTLTGRGQGSRKGGQGGVCSSVTRLLGQGRGGLWPVGATHTTPATGTRGRFGSLVPWVGLTTTTTTPLTQSTRGSPGRSRVRPGPTSSTPSAAPRGPSSVVVVVGRLLSNRVPSSRPTAGARAGGGGGQGLGVHGLGGRLARVLLQVLQGGLVLGLGTVGVVHWAGVPRLAPRLRGN